MTESPESWSKPVSDPENWAVAVEDNGDGFVIAWTNTRLGRRRESYARDVQDGDIAAANRNLPSPRAAIENAIRQRNEHRKP